MLYRVRRLQKKPKRVLSTTTTRVFFLIFPLPHQTYGCYTPFACTVHHSLRRFAPHIPHDVYRQNLHWKRRRIHTKEKKTTKKELSRSMKKLSEIKKYQSHSVWYTICVQPTTVECRRRRPVLYFFASKQVPFCCFFTRFVAYRCCTPKDRFFLYYYFPRHNSPRKYVYNVYMWADAVTLKTLWALSLPIIVGFFQLVTRSTTAILCSIQLLAFSIKWL